MTTYEVRWHMSFFEDQRIGLTKFDSLWDAYSNFISHEYSDCDTIYRLFEVNGSKCKEVNIMDLHERAIKVLELQLNNNEEK